jgi:two-component system chemotaxis response regulator CheY
MATENMSQQSPSTLEKKKINFNILIADDYEGIRISLEDALGCEYSSVESVENGELLIAKLLTPGQKCDLVITDYNMPKMDGLTVLEKIRASGNFKNLPVILMTGESGKLFHTIKQKVEELGGVCLHKPVGVGELEEVIKQIRKK